MSDDDDDDFIPNEDDEWKYDGNEEEENDDFPLDKYEDEKAPAFDKDGHGAKTIFVTYQFRHFHDNYVVIGPIGAPGQFGIAYECYQKADPSQTRRCVKEINKARFHHIDSDARNEILHTMQNEIAILKCVDHPNIVKLFDVYEDRHKLHLVMEYLPGGELFGRICEKDAFSEKEAVRILKEILSALGHMHDKNILHLDLKPDNILFESKEDDACIKLIDFGMSRVVPRLAKLADRVGTPNYMAPEVFSGHYSKAADIWSVGVITFCMLFGFPPFYADEDDTVRLDEYKQLEIKIKQGFDPTVREGFGPWFPEQIPLSEDCRYLLGKMLETNVAKRWTVKECLSCVWVRGFESASSKTVPLIVRDALKKFHTTSKFKVAISNLFRDKVDEDHIREMKKFFDQLDENHDGSISLTEFKNGMMHKFNTDLSDAELEKIFSSVDIDDDRQITFDELMTITAHRMLVDEDERLYQAFTELDANGDGFISKQELHTAMYSDHQRQTTIVLKRVQSAFETADRNGDGQIDYEEFLRVLHPDFDDDTMTLTEFKSNVTESTRVRGAAWNVDYQAAEASKYVEVLPSPQRKETPKPKHKPKKMLTLGLDAFNKRRSDSDAKKNKDIITQQKMEIKSLKKENEGLKRRMNEAEKGRDNLRDKYETQMFSKLKEQTEEMNNIINTKQNQQNRLWEKDVLIANLNQLLDKRNQEVDKLKKELQLKKEENDKLEKMLQHAIDSKMRSLTQSQEEMQKMKNLINDSGNNKSNTMSNQHKKSNKQKSRHLNHLIAD